MGVCSPFLHITLPKSNEEGTVSMLGLETLKDLAKEDHSYLVVELVLKPRAVWL